MFKKKNYNERPVNPDHEGKLRRFSHSPFTLIHQGTEVSVTEGGRVKLVQNHDEDNSFDEIEVSAALIFKISNMLSETRKVEYVDKDSLKKKE